MQTAKRPKVTQALSTKDKVSQARVRMRHPALRSDVMPATPLTTLPIVSEDAHRSSAMEVRQDRLEIRIQKLEETIAYLRAHGTWPDDGPPLEEPIPEASIGAELTAAIDNDPEVDAMAETVPLPVETPEGEAPAEDPATIPGPDIE